MKRALLGLAVLLCSGLAYGATCNSVAGGCSPGPCLASAAASWSCGHVPNLGTDSINILSGHSMTLDTNLDIKQDEGDASCFDNTITGALRSDGGSRTITITVDTVDNTCADLRLEGSGATLELKAGDKMVCKGNATINECQVTVDQTNPISFLNSGTVGAEQEARSVSKSGTIYTVGGISTTGFVVGDILWWTLGAAQSFPYEITAVTSTSVSYDQVLPDSSSLDLHLTPDEGTLGGAPSSLHSLPSIVPVVGDRFRLVKPVKWTYTGASGGTWRIGTLSTGVLFNAASNLRFRGFSIINTGRIPFIGQLSTLFFKFPANRTGEFTFEYNNLGEHEGQAPYFFVGLQRAALDYNYCHDSLPNSTSTGACLDFQECSGQPECAGHPTKDLFIGHFHGTRTVSQPLQVGVFASSFPPSNVVVWEPVVHDGGNKSGIESNGIEVAQCTNCLVYRGRCWNIHDPDGSGGHCYSLSGNGSGSVIADSWAVNTGDGITVGDWTAVNNYISNVRSFGISEANGTATANGKVYGAVVAKWGQDTTNTTAIAGADVDGAFLAGDAPSGIVFAWTHLGDRTTAITLRNMVMKGYRSEEALRVGNSNNQNITMEHLTCAGPMAGQNRGCIDLTGSTVDVTYNVKDIAVDSCGGSGFSILCSTDAGTVDNAGTFVRDSDSCNTTSGTCTVAPTHIASTDLKYVSPATNNYNITDPASPLRAIGVEPGSPVGIRCIGFDPSRLAAGVTFDTVFTDVMNEACHDGDRDGYLTILEGTNTPDSCALVTDLRNAATCANGELKPGKRVLP